MRLMKYVPLLANLLAIAAAAVSLSESLGNSREIDKQRQQIDEIKNCRGEVAINIENPVDGTQVSSLADIQGSSTIHERCKYVFVIVHDESAPGRGWKIVDLIQANIDGKWAGQADLSHIPVGAIASIDARVTSKANIYPVNKTFSTPPDGGVPSNIIQVRRIQ